MLHRQCSTENEEAKKGWRFSAVAARITKENAGTEDRKHT